MTFLFRNSVDSSSTKSRSIYKTSVSQSTFNAGEIQTQKSSVSYDHSVASQLFSTVSGDENFVMDSRSFFQKTSTACSEKSLQSLTSPGMSEINGFFEDSCEIENIPENFCNEGELFLDGAESNDCIQGKVGNCWFIGALSVLATRDDLLKKVLWGSSDPKIISKFLKHGFWICKFFKGKEWHYVIIDDKLPVFTSNCSPVFGHCKNQSELWVSLVEKAYAKLHGSYESLTGGFIDTALKDLTGMITNRFILSPEVQGYNSSCNVTSDKQKLWDFLNVWVNEWGCLLGASIIPSSNQARDGRCEQFVSGTGLLSRHAYAVIDVGTITTNEGKKVKLVRVRNPWGFGEWNGPWSDNSKRV